jgi:hypothetical protein
MAESEKPPVGGKAFDSLARKLAAVPKREVVAAEKRYERRKKKRKKS